MSSISILKDRIIKSIELWHNKTILLNRTNLFEFENNLNLLFSNNKLYNNSIDIFIDRLSNYIVKNEIDLNFACASNIPKELYGDSLKLKQVLMSVIK